MSSWYTAIMQTLFLVGFLLYVVVYISLNTILLRFLVARYASLQLNKKQCVTLLLVWWVVSFLVTFPVAFFLSAGMAFLVDIVVWYALLYFLLQRLKSVPYSQVLTVYALYFVVVIFVSSVFLVGVRSSLFEPFYVRGTSMAPTFVTGDYLIVDKLSNAYQPGDVVVYKQNEQQLIHRIVAGPNQALRIENGLLVVDGLIYAEQYKQDLAPWEGLQVELGADEYFLLGDNGENSSDSRFTGVVTRDQIVGKYLVKINLLSSENWAN